MPSYKLILWICAFFVCAGLMYLVSTGGLQITAPSVANCTDGPAQETNTDYLQRQAHCLYGGSEVIRDRLRLTLIDDIYIKAWSYSLLNKVCFWISIVLAVLVLIYPALGPVLKSDPGTSALPTWVARAISTSSVQTSLTALAAATFAFYGHYKDRQSASETLMRQLVVREVIEPVYLDDVVQRIAQMDKGFGFATTTELGK
ncbi:MAG: hypothetical protein AB8B71_14750 [Paracoccaceae bacterium]